MRCSITGSDKINIFKTTFWFIHLGSSWPFSLHFFYSFRLYKSGPRGVQPHSWEHWGAGERSGQREAGFHLPSLGGQLGYLRSRNRIRRIRMFSGLMDPDPDPLVRGMDPDPDPLVRGMDPDPSIIKQKSKKNLHSYCFVTYWWLFISLQNDENTV